MKPFNFYKIILFAIIFLSKNSFAQNSDWLFVEESIDGDKFYMQKEYVTKDSEGIKIWIKVLIPKETIKNKVYINIEQKLFFLFDCKNKRLKILSTAIYSSSKQLLDNATFNDPQFQYVVPETVYYSLLNKVCSYW